MKKIAIILAFTLTVYAVWVAFRTNTSHNTSVTTEVSQAQKPVVETSDGVIIKTRFTFKTQ